MPGEHEIIVFWPSVSKGVHICVLPVEESPSYQKLKPMGCFGLESGSAVPGRPESPRWDSNLKAGLCDILGMKTSNAEIFRRVMSAQHGDTCLSKTSAKLKVKKKKKPSHFQYQLLQA